MEYIFPILNFVIPLVLVAIGFVSGSLVERRHLKRLDAREAELSDMVLTDLKSLPPGMDSNSGVLVSGAVVIGSDYFKTLMSKLRNLIGGEVKSLDSLMGRARREAICRLLEQARTQGATTVINLRMETASIGAMTRNPVPMVEVVAYGTAVFDR